MRLLLNLIVRKEKKKRKKEKKRKKRKKEKKKKERKEKRKKNHTADALEPDVCKNFTQPPESQEGTESIPRDR